MKRMPALLASLLIAACSPSPAPDAGVLPATDKPVRSWPHGAMVSAANPDAVAAAIEILEQGGHAVEAAIAAHAVLGLVEPESSGIGGSAFMLVYDRASDTMTVFDGRETAPAGASADMYMKGDEPIGWRDAWQAGISIGVPGTIDMYRAAHDAHGRLPWSGLFKPAINLANEGFEVTTKFAGYLPRIRQFIDPDVIPGAFAFLYPDGEPVASGSTINNHAYANTLNRIALEGARVFYDGDLAEDFVARAQSGPLGSAMTIEDVTGYEAIRRDAVCGGFRGGEICSAPPPSSGLAHIMIVGLYDALLSDADRSLADKVRKFVDAQRLAYADRDYYVGDPAFVDVPVQALIDPDYIAHRATERFAPADTPTHGDPIRVVQLNKAAWRWGNDMTIGATGTSHLSIIDSHGNAVSMTASVGAPFGSLRMTNGYFLNNEMTDFSFVPTENGRPVANAVAPRKRSRSSMSPTIIFDDDGELLMLTGSPGGNSILAYTTKSILAALDWGMSAQEAVDFPNIIARGETVRVENIGELGAQLVETLTTSGYNVQEREGENSGIHLIVMRPEGLEGAADSRRHGTVGTIPAE